MKQETTNILQDKRAYTLVSVSEAAGILGRSPHYIYDLVHRRKIKFYKPNGGRLFFDLAEVNRYRRDCLENGGRIYEGKSVTIPFYRRCGQ